MKMGGGAAQRLHGDGGVSAQLWHVASLFGQSCSHQQLKSWVGLRSWMGDWWGGAKGKGGVGKIV